MISLVVFKFITIGITDHFIEMNKRSAYCEKKPNINMTYIQMGFYLDFQYRLDLQSNNR